MTKYRLQSLLFVFVAFMLGCNEYMIVGVLPDIAKEFHASLSSLGYTVTLFALIYAISTPIVTTLASRFNRYHVLLVLLLIFFIGNTWTALATGFWSLMGSRVLTATVAGAIIWSWPTILHRAINGPAWSRGYLLVLALLRLLGCRLEQRSARLFRGMTVFG